MLDSEHRLFFQTLADDRVQFSRNIRAQAVQRLGFLVQDGIDDRLLVFALEREFPREHLVEHHAQRPDVGAWIDFLAQGLLGRHVVHGAQGGGLLGQR